jgi:protocatechuate 3,4-dioxygenase beta subunit
MRTPHIHFEIFGKQDRMVTQLFFPGEPLNEQDFIFKSIHQNQKGAIAQLDKNPRGLPAGEWLATWDVVLLQG